MCMQTRKNQFSYLGLRLCRHNCSDSAGAWTLRDCRAGLRNIGHLGPRDLRSRELEFWLEGKSCLQPPAFLALVLVSSHSNYIGRSRLHVRVKAFFLALHTHDTHAKSRGARIRLNTCGKYGMQGPGLFYHLLRISSCDCESQGPGS